MKHYEGFVRSGKSFAKVIGRPDEFHDAMGRITLNFSYLEDMTRNTIIVLSDVDSAVGRILTSELSFRQKLDVLGSLIRNHVSKLPKNEKTHVVKERSLEIVSLCQKSEELRNTYLHSSYAMHDSRSKTTSKAKHGLVITVESVDSGLLLDVAEFIGETGYLVRSIPLILGLADFSRESHKGITYEKEGRLVACFGHGE